MGRIVAIGGGTFEDTDALTKIIVDISRKKLPNILFIGTAAADSTNPLTSCKKSFKRVCPGTVVKKLSILRTSYTEAEIDELIAWADIIYVGGGNTEFMLNEWRKQGIDRKLRKVFEDDSAVLSGMSAGAICWFTAGYTDSASFSGDADWSYEWIRPGFDFLDFAFCPHYNDPGRQGFDTELQAAGKSGIAVTDNAAFVYDNGEVSYARSQADGQVYHLTWENGELHKYPMIPESV